MSILVVNNRSVTWSLSIDRFYYNSIIGNKLYDFNYYETSKKVSL